MTITATPLDVVAGGSAAEFTLCHGDSRAAGEYTGPDALTGSFDGGAVSRRFVGDAGIAEEAAGCAEGSCNFGVTATFSTAALAQAAALGLKTAVPIVATIKIDSATLFARASIRCTYAVVGCSLSIKYNIRGY